MLRSPERTSRFTWNLFPGIPVLDGSVLIPEALLPYTGGLARITAPKYAVETPPEGWLSGLKQRS